MAITTEQIHQTANKLAEQGIKPTQTNVREALGGGSFTTIAEALRTWRQEQETVTQLQAVVIPQDITDRTQTLTAQIWETAQALANERLAKEREALAHKEALLIGENDEMQKVVATLESEQGELLAQLDEMNNKNTAQAEQLEQEADNNRRQLEQIKQLEIQLKAQQGPVDDLAERLEKQTNLNHQQAEKIERLTADLAAAQGENIHNIENIELLGNEIGEKRKEIGELGNKIANLEINLASWQGKANIFEQQLTKAEALTSSQAEKIEKLTADLATAKATVGATKPKTATEAKQEKANNEQPN